MQNPLGSYRRTQRELRQAFEAFTQANCPTCPTPCCRRPARILPTDIKLAESIGWRAQTIEATLSQQAAEESQTPSEGDAREEGEENGMPCEYLGERGCTFPSDLRPFGCTAYICRYMYERLDRPTLARIKRLVRELESKHIIVLRTVRSVAWDHNKE